MRIVCVICTELFVVQSHISVCNCGHVFHEDCLSRWFKSGQHNCPQCRAKASDKTIIRRLYLNESTDSTLLESCSQNTGSPTVSPSDPNAKVLSKERYMSMLGKIEEFKNVVTEQKDTIKTKSELIEQKDKSLKELNTKLTNLNKNLSENQMLITYLKREIESLGRTKEEIDKKNKLVAELEGKLREYRSIELIYKDHEEGFKNEMKKYLHEGTTNVAHLHSVIGQLVKVNVVLKDFSDKQNEEKRQIRKKLLQMERNQNEKDKFISKKENELKAANEHLESVMEQMKQKELEIEKMQHKYETLKRMFHSQSYRANESKEETHLDSSRKTSPPKGNNKENMKKSPRVGGDHHKAEIFINDTLSPALMNSSRSPAKEANRSNNSEDDSIPPVQLKALNFNASRKHSILTDDSDIQFIDEINRLESNYDRKRRLNDERRPSKDSVIFEKSQFSGASDDIDPDLLDISPMPKRRKNPFAQDGINGEEAETKTSEAAATKLSLSQRILNSTPNYVPIVRPITSKRPIIEPSNEQIPMKKTIVPSANGVMYAYDGLGGRSKLFKLGEAAPPRPAAGKLASLGLALTSSASHKMAKATSSRDLMAPLPVSKTLSRNKSGNLTKFKVSEAEFRM